MTTRVLFLAERTSVPDGGILPHGSGAHVAATVSGLRQHFDVLPLFAEDEETVSSSPHSVKRFVPPRVRGLRQDVRLVRDDRSFSERAIAEATAFRPDVVYERNEYFAVAGHRVAKRLHVPHVLEVTGLVDLDFREFYRSLGEPLGSALERWKLRHADAVVTETPGLGRKLVARGAPERRLVIVPNTADLAFFGAARRTEHPDGPIVVGWIGHLMSWHSLDLLVSAAESIVKTDRRVRFDIVGGGVGLEQVVAQVAARGLASSFRFTGTVPRNDLPATLAGFDIGVVPGHLEHAFPVKLVEMGAAGLPVVAPRSTSLDEMLTPGVEYEPFTAGEVPSFAGAVRRLIDDRDRRISLGAALHAAVRDRYSWESSAEALRAVVESVVRNGARPRLAA
ncbi:MAG TPA: glycosyltransferase [Gaiellaceae bacterium]|jgi:glycosyltransferase involved in cell wall biosynthesis|nr:glycosyltransferase [Gaiellaceae bacterium]